MAERKQQCVYVIGTSDGPQKIGISQDPAMRLRHLQPASPVPLFLWRAWPADHAAPKVEAEAHRALAVHRLANEWFSVTRDAAIRAVEIAVAIVGPVAQPLRIPHTFPQHAQMPLRSDVADGITWLPGGGPLLLGDQIAAARRLAGFNSQAELAAISGVSEPTIARAEGAKKALPKMGVDAMSKLMIALERAGVEFHTSPGASLAGGVGMRLKRPA